MIHFKTIFALRSGADDLKRSLLARSPGVGQCILIVFILTVLYMAIRPCDCPTINVPFERVDAQVESTALAARARDREHPVLEEGRDAPMQEVSNASAQLWRWFEGPHKLPRATFQDAQGKARDVSILPGDEAHAPGLIVRARQDARMHVPYVFHGREVDAFQSAQDTPLAMTFKVQDGVAYLAYFPEEEGIGVEIYAVDLQHNSPVWRTTVRALDATSDVRTEVQLFLRDGRLQVMTREGDLRRIDELSSRTGEILSMQEVDAGLTHFPVQESMHETFYTRCAFLVDAHGAEDSPDCADAQPIADALQGAQRGAPDTSMSIVRRHAPSDTVYWRLNPIGERFTFFPVSKLWPEPSTDIILSHSPGHSTSVLIALDHASGDVLWSTGLNPGERCKRGEACQPLSHHLLKVDVSTVGEEPVLVVYGEEEDEMYSAYVDPRTGQIRAMIRAPRVE